MRGCVNVSANWVCAWRAMHTWEVHSYMISSISWCCDNCKVADSAINIAILPNQHEPYCSKGVWQCICVNHGNRNHELLHTETCNPTWIDLLITLKLTETKNWVRWPKNPVNWVTLTQFTGFINYHTIVLPDEHHSLMYCLLNVQCYDLLIKWPTTSTMYQ